MSNVPAGDNEEAIHEIKTTTLKKEEAPSEKDTATLGKGEGLVDFLDPICLIGWKVSRGLAQEHKHAFPGIHGFSPAFLALLPRTEAQSSFYSIMTSTMLTKEMKQADSY
jgi:hypothetical protein